MKKNSGSALTSVIVIFLLVTMIGVPLVSMVVYNYQAREFDSGIKEAEYKNEIVMDRIANIIKNEVISAISTAKTTSTKEVKTITDNLVTAYNDAYDEAYDYSLTFATYEGNNISNQSDVNNALISKLEELLKDSITETTDDDYKKQLVSIFALDLSEDLSVAKINEERYEKLCSSVFQSVYQQELLGNIFLAIYKDSEYDDLATNIKYGTESFDKDPNTGKVRASSLKVVSKYNRNGNDFTNTYKRGDTTNLAMFNNGEFELGIETEYKFNDQVPITKLSATFVIGSPDDSLRSQIEQQTIALSNPLLDYGIIVGETLTLDGNTRVDGNILARANGVVPGKENGVFINSGASLLAFNSKDSTIVGNGRIATAGDIVMDNNTTLVTGSNPIYYRNLYLGNPNDQKNTGSIDVTFNGDVLAKDDLEINLNSNVTVTQNAGSYFGYNDKNDEGPDSSSAIVINSNANIARNSISITLKDLYLAGRAFIEGVRSVNRLDSNNNPLIYKTGESISVKGNYIAYQSPMIGTANYDVDKVKFSPYFMTTNKEGIDGETNINVKLVDNFIVEKDYSDFDTENKWEYFKVYSSTNDTNIIKPLINANVKFMQGAGINNDSVVSRAINDVSAQAMMINKGTKFEEFTEYFGYYPKDESNLKNKITDWLKFGTSKKEMRNGNFFAYISSNTDTSKTLGWGTSSTGADIDLILPNGDGVNGIIMHHGDLTITDTSGIPFNGIIIVTGNLVIEEDAVFISNKENTSEIIVQNYLGNPLYTSGDFSEAGSLFNIFTYDGSGTVYVAMSVNDSSSIININDLVGIKDWKKQNYGRL